MKSFAFETLNCLLIWDTSLIRLLLEDFNGGLLNFAYHFH